MNKLDNKKIINKYSAPRVLKSFFMFGAQLEAGYKTGKNIKLPAGYNKVQNIIFCGMGGSNLASESVRALYKDIIKKPIIISRSQFIPNFVSNKTLVIVCSYSGNTAEVLEAFKQAKKKKAKIVVITGGGKLQVMAKRSKLPLISLDKKLNPSDQPRYALGLQLGAVIGLFKKCKLIRISDKEINKSVKLAGDLYNIYSPEIKKKNNLAKSVASELKGKIPLLMSADFLSASVHILANQLNESSKSASFYYSLPELNHHLLEGFGFPKRLGQKIKVFIYSSDLFADDLKKRLNATKAVLQKQNIEYIDYYMENNSRLTAMVESMVFGGWASFYLAVLYGQDPASIPYVNYFKKLIK